MKTYDDWEYASTRLNETMVRLNGKAFFVNSVGPDGIVEGVTYNPMARTNCMLDELDITPVELGYVNRDEDSMYVVRAPMREDWRQGLRYNSLRLVDGRRADFIAYHQIAQTVENNYPTIAEAIQSLLHKVVVAFSRSFAIGRTGLVFYKEEAVGNIDFDTATITLLPKFEWLNETLEEEKDYAR